MSDSQLLERYLTTLTESSVLPSDSTGNGDWEPEPQSLHNRAAASARETRQAIITLASASLGVFFLALTADITPPLTSEQKFLIAIALLAMAFAVFAGLWSAYADAQWSYYWAKQIAKQSTARNLRIQKRLRQHTGIGTNVGVRKQP